MAIWGVTTKAHTSLHQVRPVLMAFGDGRYFWIIAIEPVVSQYETWPAYPYHNLVAWECGTGCAWTYLFTYRKLGGEAVGTTKAGEKA